MVMTPEAKGQLSKTIRALRTRLLEDFKSANDSSYKYSIRRIDQAKLSEANATRRRRIEEWIAEQVRGEAGKKTKRTAEDFRRDLEKQAAYTLLNRMLILRLMEAMGLHRGDLIAKGWNSAAYKSFRFFSQEIVRGEESEGYSVLLQMVFDDLAMDMPGLYGNAGISDLIPVPTKTLRAVVDAFADPELESCWTDDMTLGWVYQYWNDPEREALDAKVNDGGKIELHEIASKTQMFTERYMVDWLLQNSLGPMWLAICKKHGWTPLAESSGALATLEQRRAEWRFKRDAGEVALTDLMPLHNSLERQWAYYVPHEIPVDAAEHAPETIRQLKILDPAVGSGHFLVVAFDHLFALYREEAQHRDEIDDSRWSAEAIVESILENNLHGIDLDPRAVQIAAASLWLKARSNCFNAHPRYLNLVASNLQLASLPHNDPAIVELRTLVERETAMPGKLIETIVQALHGADHLGSLLQIDKAVDDAIVQYESTLPTRSGPYVRDIFGNQIEMQQRIDFDALAIRESIVEGLERFLKTHTSGDDLGLRTRGHQLASGVRFMRMLKEASYHIVIANPPYQGTSKLRDATLYERTYPLGKTDLFAGMTLRALELLRPSGVCAMIALSNWMFIKSFLQFRTHVLKHHLASIADLGKAAFSTGGTLISTACYVIRNTCDSGLQSVAIRPMSSTEIRRDADQPMRSQAALVLHRGRFEFEPVSLSVVPERPLVYWWPDAFIKLYEKTPKLSDQMESRIGLRTSDNGRFIRHVWEVNPNQVLKVPIDREFPGLQGIHFVPHLMGAAGRAWIDNLTHVIDWRHNGLEICVTLDQAYGAYPQSTEFYFQPLIALPKIGSNFCARTVLYRSIFDCASPCVFPELVHETLCTLNTETTKDFVQAVNPTINVQPGDIDRIPLFNVPNSNRIFQQLKTEFFTHESARECSVDFKLPGRSRWEAAIKWADLAVNSDAEYVSFGDDYVTSSSSDWVSYSFGVAIGRFTSNGMGVVDSACEAVSDSLPHGIMFLDSSLDENDLRDSLGHPAVEVLHSSWAANSATIDTNRSLRHWLSAEFFRSVHKDMYENRPIYWPLSSRNRTFVAWINIHCLNMNTLRSLLADHLQGGALPRIDGELEDLRKARAEGAKGSDARFLQVQKWKVELDEFIALVKECSEKGPPPTDDKCPKREVDSRYDPNIDDGVMINSAALWPLLEPQWKDPKKWWKELAVASSKGNKDYDWSHLAMRYFPKRVDEKCQKDPSLGVAHGCFWKYHPAKAWAWELRLQDEIAPDFRIEEASYRGDGGDVEHRAAYLRDHALEAIASIEKEVHRRRKDAPGKFIQELTILEPGLWSFEPEACWDMETRIIKKQEFGFRLIAPDEAEARAKLIAETPQKETGRRRMLEGKGGSATYLAGWEEAVENS
jgi:hypothetical protein